MTSLSPLAQPLTRPQRSVGWLVIALGVLGVSWWIWAWSRVHTLLADHVGAHGQLPRSASERAGLYSNGTAAEQRLSAELDNISGLYPWGPAPLVLAVLCAAVGWFILVPKSRFWVGIGLLASLLLMSVPLLVLNDSIWVALDILE